MNKPVMVNCIKCGNAFNRTPSQVKNSDRRCKACFSAIMKQRYDPIKQAWDNMISRCYDKNCPEYIHYGGRGISVCNQWLTSPTNFRNDMGPKPFKKAEIERINNNGNYEPSNCRWASRKEQVRNRRTNVRVTHNGETKCISEWAEHFNFPVKTLRHRICKLGFTLEEALNPNSIAERDESGKFVSKEK